MSGRSLDNILFSSSDVIGYEVDGDTVRLLTKKEDRKLVKKLSSMGYNVVLIKVTDDIKALGR